MPEPLPPRPPPCPKCGYLIESTAYMPLGTWDYVELPDGRAALQLVSPLDPLIIPFLMGVPVAHICAAAPGTDVETDIERLKADGAQLVAEAEAYLRSS